MAQGPMQFGKNNDAGSNGTNLESRAPWTLLLSNHNAELDETGTAMGLRGSDALVAVAEGGFGVHGGSQQTIGVFGSSAGGNVNAQAGVKGYSRVENGNGVVGYAEGPEAYGVWGASQQGFAGFFDGRVRVLGYLDKPGGGFRIDHPLDPENRYLHHAFVESPMPTNVYSGTETTDQEGYATVTLPEYFEALNDDFHYQLTVIGGFAQAVVEEEIHDNRFSIRTDRPGVKVSWQVTGVRRDAYARSNRMEVEEEKPPAERGTYLHPEAFGQPAERGEAHKRTEAMRLVREQALRSQSSDTPDAK